MASAAWQLNTWAKSSGGTIDSRNQAAQTSANGSIFKTYTTHATLPITVTAPTGYSISNITLNGSSLGAQSSPYTANVSGGVLANTAQSLFANFAAAAFKIEASAGDNGSVAPKLLDSIYFNAPLAKTVNFRITPKPGYRVASVAAPSYAQVGVVNPATGVFTLAASGTTNQVVTVKIPAGTSISSDGAITATIDAGSNPIAAAGAPKFVAAGSVTLTGTNSNATFQKWSSVSVPAGATAIQTQNVNPATFNLTVAGIYNFLYRVAGSGSNAASLTNVTVGGNSINQCIPCHTENKVGGNAANGTNIIGNNWTTAASLALPAIINPCSTCHVGTDIGAHPGATNNNCIGCHSLPVAQHNGNVADNNNGVRAITAEFGKWSHHVTGVTLNNAHCAACHLEGKVANGAIVIDKAYHMADNKTHLRNADSDADMAWNPAAPSFTTMDNFCMSCHDANGATSSMSIQIQAFINTNNLFAAGKSASASNPFGDTISNQYDTLERPAVVDAKGQFNTTNASHHAVLGKKYTGRTRAASPGARTVDTATFRANSSATMPGARKTIFDAGKFTGTYTTLADAAGEVDSPQELTGRNGGTSLGDDSTLHCGDCHTVGQYRLADVGVKPFNSAVIGAHGSQNEYMLRNNAGTDARHTSNYGTSGFVTQDGTKPYLVCYNCHAIATYGLATAHAGEHDTTGASRSDDCNGPANTISTNVVNDGEESRLISNGVTPITGVPAVNSPFGNMFGIQCAACHNSGIKGNIFGGIHGSKFDSYTAGDGNSTKHRRFLPGLNNVMFVPGTKGGVTSIAGSTTHVYNVYSSNKKTGAALKQILLPVRNDPVPAGQKNGSYSFTTGGISNDLNWEQWKAQSVAGETDNVANAMGCYTVGPEPTTPVAGASAEWLAAVPGGSNYQSASTVTGRTAIAAPTNMQNSPKVAYLGVDGYVEADGVTAKDDVRYSATYQIKAGDGRETFEVWGGCDDHNGAKGKAQSPTRNVLRPVSY
jgi:hypothetical protein